VHSKGQSDARTGAYEHEADISLYKEVQFGRVADEMRRSSGRSGGRQSLPQYLPARLARSLVTYRPIRWSGVCARYLNETGDMVTSVPSIYALLVASNALGWSSSAAKVPDSLPRFRFGPDSDVFESELMTTSFAKIQSHG